MGQQESGVEFQTQDRFADKLAAFANDLTELRVQHGNPSYRAISERARRGRPLSSSALSEVMNGKRLPRLDFLMELVRTLLTFEEEDPRSIDRSNPRLQEWRSRWEELQILQLRDKRSPVPHPSLPPGPQTAPHVPLPHPAHREDLNAPGTRATPPRAMANGTVQGDSRIRSYWPLGKPLTHADVVRTVSFSPDGQTLATGDTTAQLWDVPARRRLRHMVPFYADSVVSAVFSPDGLTLLAASHRGDLLSWNVATGDRADVDYSTNRPQLWELMTFSPEGHLLATGNGGADVQLWEVDRGRAQALYTPTPTWDRRRPFSESISTGHTGAVRAAAFMDSVLATGSDDGTIRLWDLTSWQPRSELTAARIGAVRTMAFSPDGSLLAVGGLSSHAVLWSWPGHLHPQALFGHTGSVTAVAFSPDGRLLATGSRDKTVRLWDCGTREPLGPALTGHTGSVTAVAFSPDGRLLATGSRDKTVRLWEAD